MASKKKETDEALEQAFLEQKNQELGKWLEENGVALDLFINITPRGILPSGRLVKFTKPKLDDNGKR